MWYTSLHEMTPDTERWLGGLGERFLKAIGLCEGQTVLDFGCGNGAYAIPAAYVLGPSGQVYALDVDRRALDQLRARARRAGLENIAIVHSSGGVDIPLGDASVDVVLLYDVLHPWYFSLATRRELLHEVYRIARPEAQVSVYPHHMDWRDARRQVEDAGFRFQGEWSEVLLHNGSLIQDQVLNFFRPKETARGKEPG